MMPMTSTNWNIEELAAKYEHEDGPFFFKNACPSQLGKERR